jgi:hypothetical protein
MVALEEVFGITSNVDTRSYVDRGGLDQKFRRALASDTHIAVHGGSKQGKSWLRTKAMKDDQAIVIQCTPDSSAESLVREALGHLGVVAVLRTTTGRELEGTLDFKGAVELGKIIAKVKAEATAGGSLTSMKETETEPIGQTPADLSWVATTIKASGRRLVLEDFHYIDESTQRKLAFLIKAMGEYGLFVVVIGVWPRDHQLTYYNGDLDGRIVDVHLQWSDEELSRVLDQGCDALRIHFEDRVRSALVTEAYGNVGLVQRLAESVCIAEGILETNAGFTRRTIGTEASLRAAQQAVADQMQGRFQTFADNFVRGMRRLPEGLEVYRHLLEAVTEATDEDLIAGIDSQDLLHRVGDHSAYVIRPTDLTQALDRIDRLQVRIDVHPPVLTYNRSNRKLFLADRAFLFFRRYGRPHWPWASGEPEIVNDLAAEEPLEFDGT